MIRVFLFPYIFHYTPPAAQAIYVGFTNASEREDQQQKMFENKKEISPELPISSVIHRIKRAAAAAGQAVIDSCWSLAYGLYSNRCCCRPFERTIPPIHNGDIFIRKLI